MRVKYAAGIVKNRVTADRRVTCAIEHVGSIPSFHRSAHLVTPPPPASCFPILPPILPSSSLKISRPRLAIIAISSPAPPFSFFFSIIHGDDGREGEPRKSTGERREEGGERRNRRASLPTILARITVDTRSSWAAFASFVGGPPPCPEKKGGRHRTSSRLLAAWHRFVETRSPNEKPRELSSSRIEPS